MGRCVQLDPDPIQPTRPDRNRSTCDRSVSSNGRRRVAKPRNRVQRVGWRVLSSKTRLNWPNQSLNEIRQNKNFSASFWKKYFRFLWDLGRILGDVTEFSEILARSGGNLTGSSAFWPKINYFGRIFHRGRFQPNWLCFWHKTNHSDPTLSPVGQNVLHPSLAGRSRIGHKPDPNRLVNTPRCGAQKFE